MVSRASEVQPREKSKEPLDKFDGGLVDVISAYLKKVAEADSIIPMRQAIIPLDHQLKRITIYHDASVLCSSYMVYFMSVNAAGETDSILVRASSKLAKRSIPVMECLSR